MKHIIRWTLWARRRSLIFWSLGVSAFMLVNLVFYPSFKDQAAELQQGFEDLPEAAIQLMGGSTDFFSPVGFLNSQIYFIMLPLLLGILAINLGSRLLASEEREGTIELLLTRPISRSKLLLAKALSGIIFLGIVTLLSMLTILITARLVDLEVAASKILFVTLICFLLALSWGAVAFAISALGKARGLSVGLAAMFALGGYLLSSLMATVSWLEIPARLFPFHYYQSEAVLLGTFSPANILYFLGIITLLSIIAQRSFSRRDIG